MYINFHRCNIKLIKKNHLKVREDEESWPEITRQWWEKIKHTFIENSKYKEIERMITWRCEYSDYDNIMWWYITMVIRSQF